MRGGDALFGVGAGTRLVLTERIGDGSWVRAGELLIPVPLPTSFDFVIRGSRVVVGIPKFFTEGLGTGVVIVFDRQVDGVWSETARILTPDGDAEFFGTRVAVEGDRIAIGATYDSRPTECADPELTGAVYIYRESMPGAWQLLTVLKPAGDLSCDSAGYGSELAMQGGFVLAGGQRRPPNQHFFADLWENAGATYTHMRRVDRAGIGLSVTAIDSGRVYVGDSERDRARGAIEIFEDPRAVNVGPVAISASDATELDYFGSRFAVRDEFLASCAASTIRGGGLFIYRRTAPSTWEELARYSGRADPGGGFFCNAVAAVSTGFVVQTEAGARYFEVPGN